MAIHIGSRKLIAKQHQLAQFPFLLGIGKGEV